MNLHKFLAIRRWIVTFKKFIYCRFWGMDIHPTADFSLNVRFDKTYPKGVHIKEFSRITFDVVVLCHDHVRTLYTDTTIGKRCFIGNRSIIMPGVEIGDGCVVGAGSVVTKNVPPNTLVAGNPARIMRRNIKTGPYGKIIEWGERADENI